MEMNEAIEILANGDEKMLCELDMPRVRTTDDLLAVIKALSDRSHDYGTCVYAMSIAGEAAFNLMAHVLGVTGFQASCADLDILKRTRNIDAPFALINGHDLLYPQYDIPAKVEEMLMSWRPWAKEEAEELLASKGKQAHPNVQAHWRRLAAFEIDPQTSGNPAIFEPNAKTPQNNVETDIKQ